MNTKQRRFAFGKNWARYQKLLTEDRISVAEQSLKDLLLRRSLEGCSFLDIGSGSGLFSLAARRLGAEVFSFDFDEDSVACTQALKERFYPQDPGWHIARGSVLDEAYIESLPPMNVVYSWGVLHHTGDMWRALELAARPIQKNGVLAIAIYNDQGFKSRVWKQIKAFYCINALSRGLCVLTFIPLFAVARVLIDLSEGRNPVESFRAYSEDGRGMAILTDWLDWLGGYPFEVASPEEIVDFYRDAGFLLKKIRTVGSKHGCNEFVLQKTDVPV